MGIFFIAGIILVFICVAILILNRYRMPEIVKLISNYLIVALGVIIAVHSMGSKGGLVYFAEIQLHALRYRSIVSFLDFINPEGIS